MNKRIVMMFAAVLLTAATARASSIVFDGGPPDQKNIYFADTDYAWTSATESIQAFTLSGETIIGANWWGGCVFTSGTARSATDGAVTPTTCSVPNFLLSFYDNSGAGVTPGSVVASFTVAASQALTGFLINGTIPEYHYSASFGPLALPAGQYLFGVSAILPGASGSGAGALTWGMETAPGGEGQHFQLNNGTWEQPPNELAFNLVGPDDGTPTAVPEPATVSLVAIGLAGAALRRRRQG